MPAAVILAIAAKHKHVEAGLSLNTRGTAYLGQNQLRGDDFPILRQSGQLERAQGWGASVISIKRLQDATVTKIDANSSSFWAASQSDDQSGAKLGLLERQRLRSWLKNAYDEIARVDP